MRPLTQAGRGDNAVIPRLRGQPRDSKFQNPGEFVFGSGNLRNLGNLGNLGNLRNLGNFGNPGNLGILGNFGNLGIPEGRKFQIWKFQEMKIPNLEIPGNENSKYGNSRKLQIWKFQETSNMENRSLKIPLRAA